tara:strand:+ start:1233 stop:2090 length:858 start_codon:yes stop_codon:yes gene_type:complete
MTEIVGDIQMIETCWRYFVLGVIQGITEFLPISSTAHLKAIPMLMGWPDPGVSVSAAIQLGSIFAVITYFKNDLLEVIQAIIKKEWKNKNAGIGIALIKGTIPIIAAGLILKVFWPYFENSIIRSIPSIALISIIMALLLLHAEKKGKQKINIYEIKSKHGLIIGFAQILALIPGVSRSGITLTAALLYGYKRSDAARFSFLLGIPAISMAGFVELKEALNLNGQYNAGALPLIIGISSSAVVSWISIDWMIKYLKRKNTKIFIYYRLIFGITLLLWWLQFNYNL